MHYRVYLLIDQSTYDANIYSTKIGVYKTSYKHLIKTSISTIKLVYSSPILLSEGQAYKIKRNTLKHFANDREGNSKWIKRHYVDLLKYISEIIQKISLFTIYEKVDNKYISSETKILTFKFDKEDVNLENTVTLKNKEVLYGSKLYPLIYYHFNISEYINLLHENKMLKDKLTTYEQKVIKESENIIEYI